MKGVATPSKLDDLGSQRLRKNRRVIRPDLHPRRNSFKRPSSKPPQKQSVIEPLARTRPKGSAAPASTVPKRPQLAEPGWRIGKADQPKTGGLWCP